MGMSIFNLFISLPLFIICPVHPSSCRVRWLMIDLTLRLVGCVIDRDGEERKALEKVKKGKGVLRFPSMIHPSHINEEEKRELGRNS